MSGGKASSVSEQTQPIQLKQTNKKLKIDLFFFSIRAVVQFSQFYSSK